MYGLADKAAFARDADCCPMVITRGHTKSEVCILQNLNRRRCSRFDFILENDQT
jgi:hypothetical protein